MLIEIQRGGSTGSMLTQCVISQLLENILRLRK